MNLPLAERVRYTLPRIKIEPTPNQSARTHGNDAVDLIVAHTPEGPYENMIGYIRSPAAQVSYHVLISEDGKWATQFVPFNRKAWHAGVMNSRSEGIALAGYAKHTRALSPGGRAMARVIAYRLRKRGLPPKWRRRGEVGGGFCRHADLQTDRSDPMSLPRWLTLVAMVKFQYRIGGFRQRWGLETTQG